MNLTFTKSSRKTARQVLCFGLLFFLFFHVEAQKTFSLLKNEFSLKSTKSVHFNSKTYELLSVEGNLENKPIQYSFDNFKSIAGTSSNGIIPILNESKKNLQIQAMNSVMAGVCTGTFTLSANTSQVCDGGNASNPKLVNFSGAAIAASDGAHTAILKLGGITILSIPFTVTNGIGTYSFTGIDPPVGLQNYQLSVDGPSSCSSANVASSLIDCRESIVLSFAGFTSELCDGASIAITATKTAGNPTEWISGTPSLTNGSALGSPSFTTGTGAFTGTATNTTGVNIVSEASFTAEYSTGTEACPVSEVKSFTIKSPPQSLVASASETTICNGGTTELNATSAASPANDGYTYSWTGPASYAASGSSQTLTGLTTSGIYTVTISNGCSPSTSASVAITVQSAPTAGTIAGDQTICSTGDPVAFTSTMDGTVGGGAALSYRWESNTNLITPNWETVLGETSSTYDVPNGLTATTQYRRVTVSTLNTVACEAISNEITVTTNICGVQNVTTGVFYATIQGAIDAAATLNGHIIAVASGTYAEEVVVNKELDIRGPNYGISPNTGSRNAEAVVVPSIAAIASGEIFHIDASNVSIDGFTINGDNTELNSGFTNTTAADIDAAEGITIYEDNLNNLKVQNNIVQNLSYFGISLFGGSYSAPASSGHLIHDNLFMDLGTYDQTSGISKWGGAILLYNSQYARITDNVISNARLGIQTGNFHAANPASVMYQVIDNNTIEARKRGIFYNLHTGPAVVPLTVSNNTIAAKASTEETAWDGILVSSLTHATGVVENNIIDGAGADASTSTEGIEIWNVDVTTPVTILGGTISNVDIGVFLNNWEGYKTNAADGAHASLSGVTINPKSTGVGIKVLDSDSSSTHANVELTLGADIVVNGGLVGLLVQDTTAKVNSPSGNIAFVGQTGDYISLMNSINGFDATAASFDGKVGATASDAENFAIEDKITHKVDNTDLGFVIVKANNDFVTSTGSIQNGVDAAPNGYIVNVAEGTYAENVIVNKGLDIRGPNYGISPNTGTRVTEAIVVPATSGSDALFTIGASDVSIDGFRLDGDNTSLTSGWLGTNGADIDVYEGVVYYDAGNTLVVNGLKVENNIIQNVQYFGVDLFGWNNYNNPSTTGHLISNNLFKDLGTYNAGNGYDKWGGAVLLYNDNYAHVTDNVMNNVRTGIQTGNFHDENPGDAIYQKIENNNIQTRRLGIFFNLHTGPAVEPMTVSNNTITAMANSGEPKWSGMLISSLSNATGTLSGNIIDGSGTDNATTKINGIEVWNVKNDAPVAISGGTISNVNTGIFLNNFDGYSTDASNGAHASISDLTIAPNSTGTGIRLLDSPNSTHVAVEATLGADIIINGGTVGIAVDSASAKVNSPLGNVSFTGQTGDYIKIRVNANDFDATAASFDGKTGATASNTENFAIEDKITHKIDDAALGLVRVKAAELFVTTNSGNIQRAVDAATASDIVNVSDGTFAENVVVDKQLTINGNGETTIVEGGTGSAIQLLATASGASDTDRSSLKNLKLTNSLSGVFVNEVVDHVAIENVGFYGNTTYGVNFGNSTGILNDWIIDNSTFDSNATGVKIATKGNINGVKIANSIFNNNSGEAIHAAQHSGSPGGFSNVEILDNQFTLNGHTNNKSAIYAEKLQGALIKGNTFTNNGTSTNSRGMIINLKYGNYSDLTISENIINETRGGTLTGGYGVSVAGRNDASYASNPASLGMVDLSKNEIDGFYIGIGIDNNVDWNSSSVTNNKVLNSAAALSATGANTGLSLTLNQNDFSGSSGYALYNGVTGSSFDATCNWFGSTEAITINGQINGDVDFLPFGTDGTDDNLTTLGFQPVAGFCNGSGPVRLYTDNNLSTLVSSYFNIQDAVDAASAGNAIEVDAGTYNESVLVNKSLTILGPNQAISPNTGTRMAEAVLVNLPAGRAFSISSGNTDVTISGFKFDGGAPIHDGSYPNSPKTSNVTFSKNLVVNSNSIFAGTNTSWADVIITDNKFEDVNATATASAIYASQTSSTTVTDNTFSNINYAAIIAIETPTVNISGNTIHGTGAQAIQLAFAIGDATVENNKINDANRTLQADDRGAIRLYGSDFTGAVSIANNEITGGYNGITVKDGEDITSKNITISENSITGLAAGKAIYHGGTGVLNATCNWFGSTEPVTINGQINGDVNFLPFGTDGTDDNLTTLGFQPVAGFCNGSGPVRLYTDNNLSTLVSSYFNIQDAVDAASAGNAIEVEAGTYAENVTVNKEVVILGANANTDCGGTRNPESVVSVTSGLPFHITADNVVINGFEVTAPASSNAIVIGAVSNASIQFNNIHDIGTSYTGGNVHAILHTVPSSPNSNITVSDNCINTISSIALSGYSSSAVGILQSTSTGVLTGLNIERNLIDSVTVNSGSWPTGKIAYGIQINVGGNGSYLTNTGNVKNASIANNEITKLSGHIATAIALEGNTEDALVTGNKVSDLASTKNSGSSAGGGYDLNGLKFENNRYVSSVTVTNNSFETNTFSNNGTANLGYGVVNYVPGSTATLGCNWFGTAIYNEIEDNASATGKVLSKATANILFSPYLTDGGDGAGIGFQPTGNCSGSPLVIASAVSGPELCASKGSIDVTFTGGTAPFAFSWSGGGSASDVTSPYSITGLDAGTYTVTVSDNNGSSATATSEVVLLPVANVTTSQGYVTIQGAIDAATAGDVIEVCAGTYNERVLIDKSLTLQGGGADSSLQIIDGTGLVGNGDGIQIANGVKNVTISNLTVQNFSGANGNSDAGIYAIGLNDNLVINKVAIKDNVGGSGIYANGPIDGMTITNSLVEGHTTGARGIVIWNGFKENITITGNTVNNSNCCGIELQDGTASAVNISNNSIDIGIGDNGMGLSGLNELTGANLIDNNTITGGGRYGIEIKNPAGGVTVSNNSVTLSSQNADLRDRAGIAVFRRGYTAGQPNIPNGVNITGNTVVGYQQSSSSEGFGIVVEGTNHTISGNTLNNNDVGIQQQSGHGPYNANASGDGDQSNLADLYFGRGNSPELCNVILTANVYSGNTSDERIVIGGGSGTIVSAVTPTVNTPSNVTVCKGETISEIVFAGNDLSGVVYNWTNDNPGVGLATSGTGTIVAFEAMNSDTAAQTANIVVTPSLNGCTGIPVTFTIVVNALPEVVTTPTAPVCAGEDLNLNVSIAASYSWSGPNGFSSVLQNPQIINATSDASGIYTVTVTNSSACTASVTTSITVYPNDAPTITADNNEICKGESVVLSGACSTISDIFRWSTPPINEGNNVSALSSTGTQTVNVAGTYSGYCETVNGCISELTAIVINEKTNCGGATFITITPELPAICPGGSIDLTATGCTGVLTWYAGAASPIIGYTVTVSPSVTTSYFVSCSSGGTASVEVRVAEQNVAESGLITTGKARIKASETIESTKLVGDSNFTPAPNVIYEAGKSIELKPGFSTGHSTVFRAEIKVCD